MRHPAIFPWCQVGLAGPRPRAPPPPAHALPPLAALCSFLSFFGRWPLSGARATQGPCRSSPRGTRVPSRRMVSAPWAISKTKNKAHLRLCSCLRPRPRYHCPLPAIRDLISGHAFKLAGDLHPAFLHLTTKASQQNIAHSGSRRAFRWHSSTRTRRSRAGGAHCSLAEVPERPAKRSSSSPPMGYKRLKGIHSTAKTARKLVL
jgi:hypothetical protein